MTIKLTENQLNTIKKGYLTILLDSLKKREDNVIFRYKNYLQGFADCLGIDFETLDDSLDKSMYSIHFKKQQVNFHTEKELYLHAKSELKAFDKY